MHVDARQALLRFVDIMGDTYMLQRRSQEDPWLVHMLDVRGTNTITSWTQTEQKNFYTLLMQTPTRGPIAVFKVDLIKSAEQTYRDAKKLMGQSLLDPQYDIDVYCCFVSRSLYLLRGLEEHPNTFKTDFAGSSSSSSSSSSSGKK
jgi:hypothetical protein